MGRTSRPLTQNDIFLGHLKVVTLEATNGRFFFFLQILLETRLNQTPMSALCEAQTKSTGAH